MKLNKARQNLLEIVELAKDEINDNDIHITATLDLEDLKSLKVVLDALENSIPKETIENYKNRFIKDSKKEKVFMTQSSQINASLINFCEKLIKN